MWQVIPRSALTAIRLTPGIRAGGDIDVSRQGMQLVLHGSSSSRLAGRSSLLTTPP
jgi:hypothetical protein